MSSGRATIIGAGGIGAAAAADLTLDGHAGSPVRNATV